MDVSTKASIIGVAVFIALLFGSNLMIEITSTRAFVTFFFSAFMAAYIADRIDPRQA